MDKAAWLAINSQKFSHRTDTVVTSYSGDKLKAIVLHNGLEEDFIKSRTFSQLIDLEIGGEVVIGMNVFSFDEPGEPEPEPVYAPEPDYSLMSQEEIDEMVSAYHQMYDEPDLYDRMMEEDELPF